MAQILIVQILSIISVVLLMCAALIIRTQIKEKDYAVKLHHALIIPGYITGLIAAIMHFMETQDPIGVILISVLTLALIIGPFNLKYREDIKLFKTVHFIVGYLSPVFFFFLFIIESLGNI